MFLREDGALFPEKKSASKIDRFPRLSHEIGELYRALY